MKRTNSTNGEEKRRSGIFQKVVKGAVCAVMAFAVSLTGIPCSVGMNGVVTTTKTAEAATTTNRVPIVAYTRNASGNVTTYSDVSLTRQTGYICYYDQCTILEIYSNGAVRVRYPIRNGTRTAYAAMSGFFENIDFSTNTMKLGEGKTAYRKSTGNATIGSVYANDDVVIIGQANGRTEVLYPTSSGYKLGWVAGSYSSSDSNKLRDPASWAISEEQALTVLFQARYYADSYNDLKAAFGYDESRLYHHYLTHGIREGRSASPIFDPVYYLNNNEDLKRAFGNDYAQAYRHWYRHGCKEGRASSKFYNGNFYRTRYSDLHNAFFGSGTGDGYLDLARHYLNFGIKEQRWANSNGYIPNINANQSVSNNTDTDSFAALRAKYPNNSLWTGSYFGKAWQCHGFALTLGYERTGKDPYGWSKVYNLNSLKPGDIIRCGRPHTIMVTGVSGNTIAYVDCNWVAKNKVRWDQTIQRQQITSKFGSLTYVMVSPK